MLTAEIGRPYDLDAEDIVGSRDCMRPGRAVYDHGLLSIMDACDDESQVERALEATMVLYPPLVCKVHPDAISGVTINVIGN